MCYIKSYDSVPSTSAVFEKMSRYIWRSSALFATSSFSSMGTPELHTLRCFEELADETTFPHLTVNEDYLGLTYLHSQRRGEKHREHL